MSTLKATNLQHKDSSDPNIVLYADGSTSLRSLNSGPLGGLRNALINGGMEVFQRETGAPVVVQAASSQYVVDRWSIRSNVIGAATTITVRDITTQDHPPGCWKAIRLQNAAVSVAPASGQFVGIQQKLEQSTTRSLGFGSPTSSKLSIGFYIRSSVAATYTLSIGDGSKSRAYLFDFAVPADSTNWTRVTHTFDTDSAIGFLTAPDGVGAIVSLYLSSASSFVGGTNESWNNGELFMTSGASNNFTQTSGAFVDLTGLQLEPGNQATPFEQRPIGLELQLCQRYYQKISGPEFTKIGLVTIAASSSFVQVPTPVSLRANPTISFNSLSLAIDTVGVSDANIQSSRLGTNGISIDFNNTFGRAKYSSDALQVNSGGSLAADAEL